VTAEPAPLPPDAGGAGSAAELPPPPPAPWHPRGAAAPDTTDPAAEAADDADPAAEAADDADPAAEAADDADPAEQADGDRGRAAAADGAPTPDAGSQADGVGEAEPVLPEVVRSRVLGVAAAALGRLPADQVPAPLRAAARFTPSKRVRLAGPALAAALSADAVFRLRAAEQIERESPDVAEAARTGVLPGAADPVELAAAAYLIRPAGWTELVERSRAALEERTTRSRDRARDAEVDKLRAELADAQAAQREQAQRARAAAEAARTEADTLRRQLREQTGARRAAERARAAAEEALAEERRRVATEDSRSQAELRRLRQRLAEAGDAVEAGRRAARETRQADEARLWLLLDTLTGAAQGLRRELALTPTDERPADSVAASQPRPDAKSARGDDPELVDRLLGLPRVHLVVDGYNVTKSGYGELPLAAQRSRLIQGLGALVARTGAEVTVVFDGATRPPAMPPAPRGVRVLFSAPGEIADDVIRRLVAAEPEGRPLMVVSSDKEVATDVARAGAYAVPSALLLRRLDRG
jgi:predicted RNA-binding protein with PIN domain